MAEFKLSKPPIVESWIAFDFDPKPDKVLWDGRLADELAESLADRFPEKEYVWQSQFRVVRADKGKFPIPESLEHKLNIVRIRNEQGSRIFQIADDRIVVNQTKTQDEWPGFETLVNDALELVDRYAAVFQPAGIRLATLHDVDIVEIPVLGGAEVEMDQYLTIVKELPQQPFGLIQGFLGAYVTIAPLDGEPLQIVSQLIPAPPESGMLRLRLDWEKRCGKVDFSNRERIRAGLLDSHRFLVDCFKAAFTTDKGLKLFGPMEA